MAASMAAISSEPAQYARIRSFPPLEPRSARLLILGSMPGVASLRAQQYYAHPRNLFWPFMAALFEVPADLPYEARVQRLLAGGIAIWDVLEACERPGSLDASIVRASENANDFPALLSRHPELRAIALNGRAAEAAFRRYAIPHLGDRLGGIALIALPSTSPANAGRSAQDKLGEWSQLRPWLS